MLRNKFDNKSLDAACRRLVSSVRRSSAEIEKVVADPYLFARISARVSELEKAESEASSSTWAFKLFNRYGSVFATAGAFVIVIAVFAFLRPAGNQMPPEVSKKAVPIIERREDVQAIAAPPVDRVENTRKNDQFAGGFHFEKSVLRKTLTPDTRLPKVKRSASSLPDAQFYAVSTPGDPSDAEAGGHIIRVEMSRSSLFALGVNLPLENDSDAPVKADLLVGRDGITRGIRVVK